MMRDEFMGRAKNDMWHDFDNLTALRMRDIFTQDSARCSFINIR